MAGRSGADLCRQTCLHWTCHRQLVEGCLVLQITLRQAQGDVPWYQFNLLQLKSKQPLNDPGVFMRVLYGISFFLLYAVTLLLPLPAVAQHPTLLSFAATPCDSSSCED